MLRCLNTRLVPRSNKASVENADEKFSGSSHTTSFNMYIVFQDWLWIYEKFGKDKYNDKASTFLLFTIQTNVIRTSLWSQTQWHMKSSRSAWSHKENLTKVAISSSLQIAASDPSLTCETVSRALCYRVACGFAFTSCSCQTVPTIISFVWVTWESMYVVFS